MKKLPLLLLVLLLSVNTIFFLLNGCCPDRGEHCGFYYQASIVAWNNADSTPSIATMPVPAKALYLDVQLVDTSYLCSTPMLPVNTAYAFKCSPFVKYEQIDSFSLTSNHDFDATHPAGTDLADVFKYDTGKDYSTRISIPRKLYLMHSPTDTGTHVFTIHLFAADPTKNLSASTLPVKLLL